MAMQTMQGCFRVQLCPNVGGQFEVVVHSAESVTGFRGRVEHALKLPNNSLVFLYKQRVLDDGHLVDYGLQEGSSIFVTQNLKSGHVKKRRNHILEALDQLSDFQLKTFLRGMNPLRLVVNIDGIQLAVVMRFYLSNQPPQLPAPPPFTTSPASTTFTTSPVSSSFTASPILQTSPPVSEPTAPVLQEPPHKARRVSLFSAPNESQPEPCVIPRRKIPTSPDEESQQAAHSSEPEEASTSPLQAQRPSALAMELQKPLPVSLPRKLPSSLPPGWAECNCSSCFLAKAIRQQKEALNHPCHPPPPPMGFARYQTSTGKLEDFKRKLLEEIEQIEGQMEQASSPRRLFDSRAQAAFFTQVGSQVAGRFAGVIDQSYWEYHPIREHSRGYPTVLRMVRELISAPNFVAHVTTPVNTPAINDTDTSDAGEETDDDVLDLRQKVADLKIRMRANRMKKTARRKLAPVTDKTPSVDAQGRECAAAEAEAKTQDGRLCGRSRAEESQEQITQSIY